MRNSLILLLLTINSIAFATDYYVSSSIGNDDYTGLSPTTSWRTIEKVNSEFPKFKPSDNILFKRGDIFHGTLEINNSGTAGNPITIGAYGEGDKPVITGFETLTSWSSEVNNIYSHSLSIEAEQITNHPDFRRIMVTVDDEIKWMGRWPDTGYRDMTADGTNTTIADSAFEADLLSELGLTPSEVVGSEVFAKLRLWHVTRAKIESHNAGTLTVDRISTRDYNFRNGFGYFLQDHIEFLSNHGDWYYDDTESKLYIYLDDDPSNFTIKAATRNHLINISEGCDYIVIENLALYGSNSHGIHRPQGIYPDNYYWTIQSLEINYCGGNSIHIQGTQHCVITNNVINNSGRGGINYHRSYGTITHNKVYNSSVIPGMSGSSPGIRVLSAWGDEGHMLVQYNHVDGTGGHGIIARASYSEYKNNLVENSGQIAGDVGGIYASAVEYPHRTIDGNIVLNAQGSPEGTPSSTGEAVGIYLDESASEVTVANNIVAYSTGTGMLLHKAFNSEIYGNLFFSNNIRQVSLSSKSDVQIEDIVFTNNILITTDETAFVMRVNSHTADPDYFEKIDNNHYLRHDNVTDIFLTGEPDPVGTVYYSIDGWQKYTGGEANSNSSVIYTDDIMFEYNATLEDRLIILEKPMMDIKGKKYINSITLPPYTAVVLMVDPNPPDLFNLSVDIDGSGFASVNGIPKVRSINVEADKTASIEAIPRPGWKFSYWTGDISSSENPLEIIIDSDKMVKAVLLNEERKVLIYPNPARNYFSIYFEGKSFEPGSFIIPSEPGSFRIIDLTGIIVHEDFLVSGINEVQIPNHLPAAIYIIELILRGLPIYVQRLIITN